MGMDNTPPRTRLIALYTAVAVATLLTLKPAFDAYYDWTLRRAVASRLEFFDDLRQVHRVKEQWADRLAHSRTPIDEAMNDLVANRPPAIAPRQQPQQDLDPLRGWTKLPLTPPRPRVQLAPVAPIPEEGAVPTEEPVLLEEAQPEEAQPEEAQPEEAQPAPAPAPAALPAPAPERAAPARRRRPTTEAAPTPTRRPRPAPATGAPAPRARPATGGATPDNPFAEPAPARRAPRTTTTR